MLKKGIFTKIIYPIFLITSLTLIVSGCGSSSGEGSGSVSLRILSPQDDSVFSAGATIPFVIETTNFRLNAPNDHHSKNLYFRHDGVDHDAGEVHKDDGITDEDHQDEHDGHSHDSDKTNPSAREGHYHVYLNDAKASDPHLTAWSETGSYQLPNDISKGTHSLRFELRDNDHVMVGVEAILFFRVE